MRVGFLQAKPKFLAVEENVERACKKLEALDFDLMVLPELFNTGYNFESKKEVESVAEEIPNGFTTRKLQGIAREKNACIVAGIAEKTKGGKLYNSAVFVSPSSVHIYRKTHLFDNERNLFEWGDSGFNVFECKGAKIGVMICYDWRFPESARTLALKGADIIAHPSNLVIPECIQAMYARSVENKVFTITADRVGAERGLKFMGCSQIFNPKGQLLYRASEDKEEAKIVEINPQDARSKKLGRIGDLFKDRRPNFYL